MVKENLVILPTPLCETRQCDLDKRDGYPVQTSYGGLSPAMGHFWGDIIYYIIISHLHWRYFDIQNNFSRVC